LTSTSDDVTSSTDAAARSAEATHPGNGQDVGETSGGARSLTVGELVGVVGAVAVAGVATASLALAQAGRHDGVAATAIGVGLAIAVCAAAQAMGDLPPVRFDLAEAGILAAVVVAGVFFFLPGFHYAYADKDPGIYVSHAFAIARDGDVYIDDPVIEQGLDTGLHREERFAGLWFDDDRPDHVTSQFYHLYSALLATAEDIGGPKALFNLNPLLAVASCCLVVLATRRAAGSVVAVIAGALLVTSMMQVWQAKYPSTEIIAQMLLAGFLLAAVLAIDRRWTGGAFVAGVLAGCGFLARPDGFLYVLLVGGVAALLIAAGRADVRVAALFAGMAVSLPFAMWNAYVARDDYSDSNAVPGPVILVGALVAMVAVGWAVRRASTYLDGRVPGRHLGDPAALLTRWQRPVGVAACVAFGVMHLAFYFRRDLFGEDFAYQHFTNRVERSYAEMNMTWLSWFTSTEGLVVMWLGLCVILLQRWRAPLFALVGTGTLLLPLYLYDARVSMRLMWWVRRFVPSVLPVIVILMAVAIGWALTRRVRVVQAAGAGVLTLLIVNQVGMSLPLRDHDEMGGSWDLSAAIAAAAGDEEGVFLFPMSEAGLYDVQRNAPGVVWLVFDQLTARLPDSYDIGTVDEYQEAFHDRPVFVVASGDQLPAELPTDRFVPARTVIGRVTFWEESLTDRPDESVISDWQVTVWQLTGEPNPTTSPA